MSSPAVNSESPFLANDKNKRVTVEPDFQKQVTTPEEKSLFRKRVRMRLIEVIADKKLSMTEVSKQLAVSTRTLQRRLKDEGTSYQNEVNSLREELARYYLINSTYSGTEIAYLLGYEDANSFIRAFHTWTGLTPQAVRKNINNEHQRST